MLGHSLIFSNCWLFDRCFLIFGWLLWFILLCFIKEIQYICLFSEIIQYWLCSILLRWTIFNSIFLLLNLSFVLLILTKQSLVILLGLIFCKKYIILSLQSYLIFIFLICSYKLVGFFKFILVMSLQCV